MENHKRTRPLENSRPIPDKNLPRRRAGRRLGWLVAVAVSLGLNLALFVVLPLLAQRPPEKNDWLQAPAAVDFLVMEKPEPEPPPPLPKPPSAMDSEPEQASLSKALPPEVQAPAPKMPAPRLALDLALPAPRAANLPAMPPPATFSVDPLPVKSVYLETEVDVPPRLLVQTPLQKSLRAQRLGGRGTVEVELTIDADGRVKKVDIVSAAPPYLVDQRFTRGFSAWVYEPAVLDGEKVTVRVGHKIRVE